MPKLPDSVTQKALRKAAIEMIANDLSIEEICEKTGIDTEIMVRFLRFQRRNIRKPKERRKPVTDPTGAFDLENSGQKEPSPDDAPKDKKLHRPKSQQGEMAVLHAYLVERDLAELDDDPLELGLVDSEGKSIPFERVFLIAIVSVFAVSILYFGLRDLLSEKTAGSPEFVSNAPELKGSLDDIELAAATMLSFIEAKDAGAKSAFVREPKIVRPLMEKWYNSRPAREYTWDEWNGRAFTLDDTHFVSVEFFDNSELSSFEALFELPENGAPKLDWESFVNYAPLSWDEFRDIRPVDAMPVRVYFEPSELYYPPFDNVDKYAPAKLTHPHSTVPLIGYLLKGSAEAVQLRDLVHRRRSNSRYPVILKLRFPQAAGIDPNLVEITEVVQTNWITQYP